MIDRRLLQRLQRRRACDPIALNNRLRVDLLPNEFLCLPENLRGKNADARRPIPDLVVLDLGYVHEDLRRRVVELNGFQDRRAVVCDLDLS